jgi:hypothetical protein
MKYTPEYLAMHPYYTGENVHEMPSLNWAMRKQRGRDRRAEKWVNDFKAGKIDEDGHPIVGYQSSTTEDGEESGDDEDGSDDGWETTEENVDPANDKNEFETRSLAVQRTSKECMNGSENDALEQLGAARTPASEVKHRTVDRRTTSAPISSDSSDLTDLSRPPRSGSSISSSPPGLQHTCAKPRPKLETTSDSSVSSTPLSNPFSTSVSQEFNSQPK